MATISDNDALSYTARWSVLNAHEERELRETSIPTKFRQLATLMQTAYLFPVTADILREEEQVRERWRKMRVALK